MDIFKLGFWLVVYIVMPAIMLTMLAAGFVVASRATEQSRLSARAGVGGGLVVFAIYFVTTTDSSRPPAFGLDSHFDGSWLPIVAGFVCGLGVLSAVQATRLQSGFVGLLTLFLAATSSIALYGYFFASPSRAFAVSFALSSMLGMILYVVLFGKGVRELLRR
ncbi:hypothetical protein [Kutzneria sp. NPDC052558]|uniref:hypothetical protein n=1 Tax=Kutzneria sp. NPDC052558 TaxID=3364121 RepID=UPI0037C54996